MFQISIGFLVLLLGFGFSCTSTGQKAVPAQLEIDPKRQFNGKIGLSLSRKKVADAAILLATVSGVPDSMGEEQVHIQFADVRVPVYPLGPGSFQGVVGVPYLAKSGKHQVSAWLVGMKENTTQTASFQVIGAKYLSEKLRVDPSKVKPNKKHWPRISREVKEIGKIYQTVTRKKYWEGNFALPVKSKVTSPFGTQRVYNGKMKGFHKGLDLRAPTGTPILSAAPGKVAMAKDLFYTGNTVIIDHGYGVITLYAHLSKLSVKKGDPVKTGQRLGLSGATGRVSGPHLHWGAIIHKVKVNPSELTKVMK